MKSDGLSKARAAAGGAEGAADPETPGSAETPETQRSAADPESTNTQQTPPTPTRQRQKLTQRVCALAACPQGQREITLWDTEIPGFGLRVTPTTKTFVLKHRVRGAQLKESIGRYPTLTTEQARAEAVKRRALALQGVDPRKVRQRAAVGDTVADLARVYMEHSRGRKKTWKNDLYRLQKHILPALGNKKIEAITKEDVRALHQKIGAKHKKPYEANRVLTLLCTMFNYAAKHDITAAGFQNPCSLIEKNKERARERFLTQAEWARIDAVLQEEEGAEGGDIYAVAAIRLAVLTGLRKRELLGLKWSQVFIDEPGREYLYLPDTKAGRSFTPALSRPAVAVLRAIPRQMGSDCVFPGKSAGGCREDVRTLWDRVRKQTGLEDVHFHDLRRTFGSWLAQDGVSLHLIGALLNQSTQQVTEVYARFQEGAGRGELNRLGERVAGASDSRGEEEEEEGSGTGKR